MKRLLFFLLLLGLTVSVRATVNVSYTFTDFTTHPTSVSRVTVTPLARGADYAGAQLSAAPLVYTRSAYPTLTNGTLTVSNLIAGYAYRVEFSDGYSVPAITNYFASGLSGNVDGNDYKGVILSQTGGAVYQFAYYYQTNTFGWSQNFATTNNAATLTNIIASIGGARTGMLTNQFTTNAIGAAIVGGVTFEDVTANSFIAGPGGSGISQFKSRANASQLEPVLLAVNNPETQTFMLIGPEGGMALGQSNFPGNGNLWASGTITGAAFNGGTFTGAAFNGGTFTGNGSGLTNLNAAATPGSPAHLNLDRLSRWKTTLTESNRPFRLYITMDQIDFPYGVEAKFRQLLGQEGGLIYGGGNEGQLAETASANVYIEPNASSGPLFIATTTVPRQLTNGATLTYSRVTATTQTNVTGDRAHVIYLKEPMGGTFKVQTNLAGAGWGDFVTVSSYQAGATNLLSTNLTLAYGAYSLRVVGLTATNRIYTGGLWNSTNKSVVTAGTLLNAGPAISTWLDSVDGILPEWFAIMSPDLMLIQDTGTTNNYGPTWDRLEAMWSTSCPNADIVIIGEVAKTNDVAGSSIDPITANARARDNALAHGRGFFDSHYFINSSNTVYEWQGRGWYNADGAHLEMAGTRRMNNALWDALAGKELLYDTTVAARNYDGPLGAFLQGYLGNIYTTTNKDGIYLQTGDGQMNVTRTGSDAMKLQFGPSTSSTYLESSAGGVLGIRGGGISFAPVNAFSRYGYAWPSGGWTLGLDDSVDPGASNLRVIGNVTSLGTFTGNGSGLTNISSSSLSSNVTFGGSFVGVGDAISSGGILIGYGDPGWQANAYNAEENGPANGYLAGAGSISGAYFVNSDNCYPASGGGGFSGAFFGNATNCWTLGANGAWAGGDFQGANDCSVFSYIGSFAGADFDSAERATISAQNGSYSGAHFEWAYDSSVASDHGAFAGASLVSASNVNVLVNSGVAYVYANSKSNVSLTLDRSIIVASSPNNYTNTFESKVGIVGTDGRFTGFGTNGFTGNGAGLTNLDAGGTNKFYSGASLVGVTTNAATAGSNWVGGISLWNPTTGNTVTLTNGGITSITLTNTGAISSGTNYASQMNVGGAASGANALNVTGTIRSSAGITTATAFSAGSGINGGLFLGGSSIQAATGDMVGWLFLQNQSTGNGFNGIVMGNYGNLGSTSYLSTNWPAIRVEASTNWPALGIRCGTNTSVFASLIASNITATASLTATNFLALPTNYVAANFVPAAGLVKIVSSNGAIFSVTQNSTNLIAGP